MASMKLEVVTPTGRVLDATVDSVTAPGVKGEFTVLPEHQPALIRLSGGRLSFEGGKGGAVLIRGGVAEIRHDGVLILADEAVLPANATRSDAEQVLEAVEVAARETRYLDDAIQQALVDDRAYGEALLKVAGH